VRHVRTLKSCVIVIFAMSLASLVVASPSLAKEASCKGRENDTACAKYDVEKGVKEEAKGKYSNFTFGQFKYCALDNPEVTNCFLGRTSGGKDGGFFELGKVKVPLDKPITLQGGFNEHNETVSPEGEGYFRVIAAGNGGETLESPVLPVEKGLGLITPEIQKRADWPTALIEKFNEAKQNKELGLGVKIEVAGNSLYENPEGISTEALLEGKGPVFELPLKTRLISPVLEKLGGGPCTVGNNEYPIEQFLTAASPGAHGKAHFAYEFEDSEFTGSRLVDLNWPVPEGAFASGCGGEYESYVDAAIDQTLELPGETGITVLTGILYDAEGELVREFNETGEVHL
jgi:hypothetical protein